MSKPPSEKPGEGIQWDLPSPGQLAGGDQSSGPRATSVLPATPLDLALLAATVNPAGARGDAENMEEALKQAAALYVRSLFFYNANSGLSAAEFVAEIADTALTEFLVPFLQKAVEEQREKESLRLYEKPISAEPDEVCRYFGWKHPRRVRDNVRAWFLASAECHRKPASSGEEDFKQFWAKSQRKDEKGRTYFALHPDELEPVKRFRAGRNTARTLKGGSEQKCSHERWGWRGSDTRQKGHGKTSSNEKRSPEAACQNEEQVEITSVLRGADCLGKPCARSRDILSVEQRRAEIAAESMG